MNLKRVALKGAVALAIVIALCMFFSQTVLTITTAKVKLVTAKRGKLEQRFTLTGELYYPASEAITLNEAKDLPSVVLATYVRAGDEVKKGDLLFTTRLLPACDEALKKAEDEYLKALDAQLKTSIENIGRKVKDTVKNEAERALTSARKASSESRRALITNAHAAGVDLPTDTSQWRELLEKKANAQLLEQLAAVEAAALAQQEALDALIAAHKKVGNNSNYTATKKNEEEQAAVDKALADLVKLQADMESVSKVLAPRDGVVVSIDVKPGENCPSDKPAYTLAASEPVLRADLSEVRKEITKDMKVEIKQEYSTLKTRVIEVKRETAAKKYAIIEITDEILRDYGGYRGLSGEKLDLRIAYTAKSTATLLPINAVRDDGGETVVFLVEDQRSFWGQESRVRKMPVHVIEKSDTQCSIEEELYGQFIADAEDRPIKDGSRVMEYLS